MGKSFKLESRALLGLLSKANELFAENDVTLSFPVRAPVSFDLQELTNALGPAPDSPAQALLAEFSTMMNWVPDGMVWPPSEPRCLDAIVRYIIEQGDWAVASSTPDEEARKSAAREIVDISNPATQDYLSLRDAWIRAKQELRNRPDDPAAVEAESRAYASLLSFPHRDTIEQAQQELITLDERAPFRTRERMLRQIDVGVGTFDDPSGGRFSPTRPLPKEVLQASAWPRVTLTRKILDQLAASAPAELRDNFIASETENDIVSISFEYASAQLNRQWLDPSIFSLRCWRFTDTHRLLSDGAIPPTGDCPSYVRAVVFARNIQVTSRNRTVESDILAHESITNFLMPSVELLKKSTSFLKKNLNWEDPRNFEKYEPNTNVSVRHKLTRRVSVSADVQNGEGDRTLRHNVPGNQESLHSHLRDTLLEEARVAPDFHMILDPSLIPSFESAPAGSDLLTTTSPDGQITLLALICKQLGRSPNPDPNYSWP